MKKVAAQSRRTRRSHLKPAAPQAKGPVRVEPEYFQDGRYGSVISRMIAGPKLADALVLE